MVDYANNKYGSPYSRTALSNGYLNSVSYPNGYKPFNGYLSAPYLPNSSKAASAQTGTVASAPAALSTLILSPPGNPNGQTITFQFVYTGGANPTLGIPIVLPAGGGTATQVRDAIVAAINAGSGVETDTGKTRYFSFSAAAVSTNQLTMTGKRNGTFGVPAGTQATITFTTVNVSGIGLTLPSRIGPQSSYLSNGS